MFAQQMNSSTLELAKMLAAPEMNASFSIVNSQTTLMGLMLVGLAVMTTASVKFTHGVARDHQNADNF